MCHGQMLSEALAKARKSHVCACCKRDIEVGETYSRSAHEFEGEFDTTKLCLRCRAVRDANLASYSDECLPFKPKREDYRETAKSLGWRETLRKLRAQIKRLVSA